jgi:hypothetical protein
MAVRIREVGPPDEDPPYRRDIRHRLVCPYPDCDFAPTGRRAKVLRQMKKHREEKHGGERQEG